MKKELTSFKQLRITGTIDFEGEARQIEIKKLDIHNNVMGFYINVFNGKKVYIGASKDNPKPSDVKNIVIEILPEKETKTTATSPLEAE